MRQPLKKFLVSDIQLKLLYVPQKELEHEEILRRKNARRIPKLKQYELVKNIGIGGFSTVMLVRKRTTGQLFGMKMISKKKIIDDDKVE